MPNALHVAEQGDQADQAVKSHSGGHAFRLQSLLSLMSTTAGKTAARVLFSTPGPHDAEHKLQLVHCLYTGSMYATLMFETAALEPLLFMANSVTVKSEVVCTDGSGDSSLWTWTETSPLLDVTEKFTGAVSFCGRAGRDTLIGRHVTVLSAQVYCSMGWGGLSRTKFVVETLSIVGTAHLTQDKLPGSASHCAISAALRQVLLTVLSNIFGTS